MDLEDDDIMSGPGFADYQINSSSHNSLPLQLFFIYFFFKLGNSPLVHMATQSHLVDDVNSANDDTIAVVFLVLGEMLLDLREGHTLGTDLNSVQPVKAMVTQQGLFFLVVRGI